MRLRGGTGIVIGVLWASIGTSAQQPQPTTVPLGDLARQAEAAKATAKKANKTYTNANLSADLRGEPTPVPAAASPSGFVSKSLGKALPPEEMVARSEQKVEQDVKDQQKEGTWRMRATSLRKQIDDMQSRVATLSVPNALTDASAVLKKANDAELANARAALDGLKKRWTRLEAEAREVKIPSEWLDPRPKAE